jgi:MtaA/CmuA family methyltransferase
MTSKERLYATVRGEPHDRVPVTPIFMAWAAHSIGRSYRDYYLKGDVLVEAQLGVAQAFGTDQVSAISDPWREAEGYGMEFEYPEEGVGVPRDHLIKSADDLIRLKSINIDTAPRMRQRVESVAQMAVRVGQTHSVLGWVEGPMAAYVALRRMEPAMLDLIEQPEMFHRAAEVITHNAAIFAKAQINAGADMIGVGDAATSLIGPEMYVRHVLPWQMKLFSGIHKAGGAVRLHICGNIRHLIVHMATSGADIIDVDWMVPLAEARQAVTPEVALCGNFDPVAVLLRGTREDVAKAARQCIAAGGDRFILMPGCEVPPGTTEENIRAFCPCEGSLILKALMR